MIFPAVVFTASGLGFWLNRHHSDSYLASILWTGICWSMAAVCWRLL